MLNPRPVVRSAALGAGLGLVVAPMALVAPNAFAAATCGTSTPAATEIAPGLCEVVFDVAGEYTFTAPAGVGRIAAVLVGAGGGGVQTAEAWAYGGAGGVVSYVDNVDVSSDVSVTVGLGGDWAIGEDADNGTDTLLSVVTAFGGHGAYTNYGGENADWDGSLNSNYDGGAGAGAGSDAVENDGGEPLWGSDVSGGDELFPADVDTAPLGYGGYVFANGEFETNSDLPGAGGNSELSLSGDVEAGNDGAVILRWAAFDSVAPLASTGVDAGAITGVAGVFAVAGAAVTAVARRRRGF